MLGVPKAWAEAAGMAAVAVVAALIDVAGLWSVFSLLPSPPPPWWTLATALPACALVGFKWRAPGITFAGGCALFVIDLLTTGGLVTIIVVLDLLYARTVSETPARRRRILPPLVVAVAVAAIGAAALAADVRTGIMIGLQLGALVGTDYWYATSVAQSRELVELHRQRAADAALLAERDRLEAVARERENMARELHDLVAGHVTAIAIRSEAALSAAARDARARGETGGPTGAPGGDEGTADRRALRAVRDASLEAHRTLRSMIAVLRTGGDELTAPPRRASLPALADRARRSGLHVVLADEISGDVPGAVDQTVGRIVQEALANGIRHASGADVDIRVHEEGDDVIVRVDSRGGAPLSEPALPGSGLGLELLSERVRALGGSLHAGPRGGGWTVRAVIPREAAA